MLTTYFKRQTTQATYYSGPAGPYLDEFTHWLEQRGYLHETIRRRLQGAAQFIIWAQVTGCNPPSLSPATLDHFRDHLSKHNQLSRPGGQLSVRWLGAQLFFEFLQDQQIVASADTSPEATPPELLSAFEQWMQAHRGVRLSTLLKYRPHITHLLIELGENPEQFDVAQLRTVILAYAQHRSPALVKDRATAFRMFLRFLIATERCQPELGAAIPTIAQWRLSTLPRYLTPEDMERVIAACESSTSRDIRDKAIVLLLARLGLRAGDVSNLKLDDIDWSQGTFRVMGKARREAKLPLPQDVGDAILHYLQMARPPVQSPHVFFTVIAPWEPITRYVVKHAAAQAIKRAGVDAPSFGAHVLRHSAATALLRQGASLQVIGEVLRHRSVETTAHYAKVDTRLLQEVTMPWPGEPSC
ncbi:MAG: tyrosine-type recombinase/integrase [Candidatus Tectomicrobia bacterium]|nr:tyrosine-type recombinase/integrase [Candidatus Tectomicrobia bacterium]